MSSKYWDDFEQRIEETVACLKAHKKVPCRRVAVFITNRCNFRCDYCNVKFGSEEMSKETFEAILKVHGYGSIIHITGGEPSTVKWLYKCIEETKGVRFHLNTNAFIKPPKNLKRLKVSLDTHVEKNFDSLVHKKGAFKKVVQHIKERSKDVVTSITCVLSKKNFKEAPEFMRFCRNKFPDLYAVFFSCYKGDNPKFALTQEDADLFFKDIKPRLEKEMDKESLELFRETASEKFRIFGKKRFPENITKTDCYLSMSEAVYDQGGVPFKCSHLFRDNIFDCDSKIHSRCINGCNRRLVKFNEEVARRLKEK